jgi:hypothetical protein
VEPGSAHGSYDSREEAVAAGWKAIKESRPRHPDDARVHGFVVKDSNGVTVAEV